MRTKTNDTPNWALPLTLLGAGYLLIGFSTTAPVEAKVTDWCPCLDWPVYEGLSIAEYDEELAALILERKAAQQAERTWRSRYPIGDAGRSLYAMGEFED